jgi:hypothetical protein
MNLSSPSNSGSSPWYTDGRKMRDNNVEQRINTRFCVQNDRSASETSLLPLAYGEYTVKSSSGFEWHRRFKEGREDVQDNPRSGQTETQRTSVNVDRVQMNDE